jgi:hypothetical protein
MPLGRSAVAHVLVSPKGPGTLALTMGHNMPAAPGHRFLPHERWFASFILERQRTHRTPDILRIEQNYGPEGIALGAASMATLTPGALIVGAGTILMLISGGGGSLLTLAYKLNALGVILILLGSIRLVQGIRAGQAFRGGRPFVRRR